MARRSMRAIIRASMKFEVIVVGAGHAGIEASLAAARMGIPTLMLSILPIKAKLWV